MRIVLDIETDKLHKPTEIWCIVCKDIDTGQYHIFRNVTSDQEEKKRFLAFSEGVTRYVGHNFLGFDWPVIVNLLGIRDNDIAAKTIDTFIISKLADYSRPGHSVEDYGTAFGLDKITFSDFSKYSVELEEYCKRDVDITHKIYLKYLKYISTYVDAVVLENTFQLIVNSLSTNGFSFNLTKANVLLTKVKKELDKLDSNILVSFPSKLKLIREVTPKETKHGTISRSSIPRSLGTDLSVFTANAPFSYCNWVDFNPSSHKQVIGVLNQAGWKPFKKTQTHIEVEREINLLKRKKRDGAIDLRLKELYTKLEGLKISGYKVNEENILTLPSSAPSPARTLARRILVESRRRTLTEWLGLVNKEDERIRPRFQGIGAWTQRMSHQNPNCANIPTDVKLYGKEMRSLWRAPGDRLLVGVDAEGIQLRIFAHYIDDKDFTEALVNGTKANKTDPHSLNQSILGKVCKSRQDAKRFIYALLLGAGLGKLAEVLGCSRQEAEEALNRLIKRYSGFDYLRKKVIPSDAKRGYFIGLDGRAVRIPGDTLRDREHLAMSGYLQNGEAIIMKKACVIWHKELEKEYGIRRNRLVGTSDYPVWNTNSPVLQSSKDFEEPQDLKEENGGIDWKFVNMVHDEWQTEVPNNMEIALRVAQIQADSLRIAGEQLKLKCPLAGSYYNEDNKDYTIGTNWASTH